MNDLRLWAVDFFYDSPLANRDSAVTAYAAWFDYDFGPNLVRNIGVNNPASDVIPELSSFNGAGNAYPLIGTGTTNASGIGAQANIVAAGLGTSQPAALKLSIKTSRRSRYNWRISSTQSCGPFKAAVAAT